MRYLLLTVLLIGSQVTANTIEKHVITTSSIQSEAVAENHQKQHSESVVTKHAVQSTNIDYWFHDVWLSLHADDDYDGFASSFTLEFDVDTFFNQSRVYAVVYLGTGNRFESLHTTNTFTLLSDSSNDRVTLDFELFTGYPTNDYNVLIEIFDAHSHELLTFVDDRDFAELYLVPLESQNYENTFSDYTVVERHGGSFGFTVTIALLILVFWRRGTYKPVGLVKRKL